MQPDTQPAELKKKITASSLPEVLNAFHTAEEQPEIDWGEPVGQEVW